MTKSRKRILIAATLCVLMCFSSATAIAASLNYSTAIEAKYAMIYNTSATSQNFSVNTRPTEGKGGVLVKLRTSTGSNYQKVFPYYTFVDPLIIPVESGAYVDIYIGPQSSGQVVTGILTYNFV